MNAPYEITAVRHLGGHRLRLTLADGTVGDVDLADRFAAPRGPLFEPLRDVAYFARVAVDPELGTVVWPNGADLAPDALHQEVLSLARGATTGGWGQRRRVDPAAVLADAWRSSPATVADVGDRGACPHCGESRVVFDASYQPRCWTCGGSRVQEPSVQPPLPVPGAPLPTSASTYQRWRAGDFLEIYRSRAVQRRNLIIIAAVALAFAGLIVLALLTTDFDDDPGALQARLTSHRALDVTVR